MDIYALLNGQLYTMSDSNVAELKKRRTAEIPGQPCSQSHWDEHYVSTPDGRGIISSNLDITTPIIAMNKDNINEVIQAIKGNNLTEMKEMNPAIKIAVTYAILDAAYKEIESAVCKVVVGELGEVAFPRDILNDDSLQYDLSQVASGRVIIGAPFHELGISRATRGASRIVRIDNVVISISTTNKNIYSEYLSNAQTSIGWTVSSPTQKQVSEYDIPIFNLADYRTNLSLPHYIEVTDRSDHVFLNVKLLTNIFAYTYMPTEIEDALFLNQRMQTKYSVTSAVDGHCTADVLPETADIVYGTPFVMNVTADKGHRIMRVSMDISRDQSISFDVDDEKFVEDRTASTTSGLATVTWDETKTHATITISSVEDFYKICVYTTTAAIIPADEPSADPSTPPSETPGSDTGDSSGDEGTTKDDQEKPKDDGTETSPSDGDAGSSTDESDTSDENTDGTV